MCETLTFNASKALLDRRDPSRTSAIRQAFIREVTRRFKALTKAITKSVATEDVFGLLDETTITVLADIITPGRRAFAFPRDSRKLSAFMDWLKRQVEAGILDIRDINQVGEGVENAWTNKFIYDSYKRGVLRARVQLKEGGYPVVPLESIGGITALLQAPIHIDRIGLLFTRAFNELKGITDAMAQVVSQTLAIGMADGLHPRIMAKMLVHSIDGLGDTLGLPISYVNKNGTLVRYYMPAAKRAQILARTETIRAHAMGQLQEFKNWGVVGVNVKAELVTAGDQRVCPECAALEGSVYTLEEAHSVIPVHPQCRCIWIPLKLNN